MRLGNTGRKDMGFWRKLGPEGRCMLEVATDLCKYSDATDLGWAVL